MPSRLKSSGIRRNPCTPSTWIAASGAFPFRSRAISASGSAAPVSLLTCITEIITVSGSSRASSFSRSTEPFLPAGISSTVCPIRWISSAQAETAGCSTEEISTFPGLRRLFRCPSKARLSASVPPEVKMAFCPAAPAAFRQISRTASIFFWISRAGLYKADGLYHPPSIRSVTAAATAVDGRVVALLSRYACMSVTPGMLRWADTGGYS